MQTDLPLSAILSELDVGIVSLDESFKIIFLNPAAEKFFNRSAETLLGQALSRSEFADFFHRLKLSDLKPVQGQSRAVHFVERDFVGAQSAPVEAAVTCFEQSQKIYYTIEIRFLDQHGRVGDTAPGIDQAEMMMRRDARKTAHDFNNVLTAILSHLDLAMTADAASPFFKEQIAHAQAATRHGIQVVNTYLALMRSPGKADAAFESEILGRVPGSPPAAPALAGGEVPSESLKLEGHERILIVDDEELVRLVIRTILAYRGYEIVTAADGEEGIAKYMRAEPPFDLVILDLDMPRVNGWTALARIKQYRSQAAIILLSGGAIEGEEEKAIEEGAAGLLFKPFKNEELLLLIRKTLDEAKKIPT